LASPGIFFIGNRRIEVVGLVKSILSHPARHYLVVKFSRNVAVCTIKWVPKSRDAATRIEHAALEAIIAVLEIAAHAVI
jgi:hypothetical protein